MWKMDVGNTIFPPAIIYMGFGSILLEDYSRKCQISCRKDISRTHGIYVMYQSYTYPAEGYGTFGPVISCFPSLYDIGCIKYNSNAKFNVTYTVFPFKDYQMFLLNPE